MPTPFSHMPSGCLGTTRPTQQWCDCDILYILAYLCQQSPVHRAAVGIWHYGLITLSIRHQVVCQYHCFMFHSYNMVPKY